MLLVLNKIGSFIVKQIVKVIILLRVRECVKTCELQAIRGQQFDKHNFKWLYIVLSALNILFSFEYVTHECDEKRI